MFDVGRSMLDVNIFLSLFFQYVRFTFPAFVLS